MHDKCELGIIAHNEDPWILACLYSAEVYAAPSRIVLLCDACTDKTVETAQLYGPYGVEVYEEQNRSIGQSMVSVVAELSGPLVWFMHGDVQLTRHLDPLLEYMSPPMFQVSGMLRHVCSTCGNESYTTRRHDWGACQSLCLLRRRAFLDVVKDMVVPPVREDKAICLAAKKMGWGAAFDARHCYGIHHRDPRSPVGALSGEAGGCRACHDDASAISEKTKDGQT